VIAAKVVLDSEGWIARFEAQGHSRTGPAGRDIVCAAFTILARTTYEALAALPGAEIEGSAPFPGELSFRVRRIGAESSERAAGITDFLLAGISGLEREYPGEVGLTIERFWRE
jgi:uncharacterized protein YsxB (DUF464 family)